MHKKDHNIQIPSQTTFLICGSRFSVDHIVPYFQMELHQAKQHAAATTGENTTRQKQLQDEMKRLEEKKKQIDDHKKAVDQKAKQIEERERQVAEFNEQLQKQKQMLDQLQASLERVCCNKRTFRKV